MAKSEGITKTGARCPVCASATTTPFYSLADAPVTCATVFPDAASARAVQRGSIRLRCCNDCGFIYNDAFDPTLGEIGASYEASQASSVHFSAFARSLAGDWIERYGLRGKRVLEVGCGHGEFLAELVRAGALEGIGLDPVADPERRSVDVHDRIELRAEFFGEAHIDVAADALICRHTLEHIDDVFGFLQLVRTWAERDKDRVVLFEVPGSERILAEAAFWDVLYEHCNYFVASSLRFAFALAGLHVMRTALVYDRQYLLIEAQVARSNEPSPTPGGADAIRSACLNFGARSGQAIARSRAALSDLAERARPLVLWQGAAKTVGFLSALGDDGLVDCAIDLNVHRHGGYLPPFGLPVVAPETLTQLRPKDVVLMNPVYYGEVTAKLHALGIETRLLTVDQLYSEQKAAHGENIHGF